MWIPSGEHLIQPAYPRRVSRLLCVPCVAAGDPPRRAADAVHPDDDMRAHDLAHALYLRLHAEGTPDAY